MNETYLVFGTRKQIGGKPEPFQIEKRVPSSRTAYVEVKDALYNTGYEVIQVVAIKMRCQHCGDCHVLVDPNLYL